MRKSILISAVVVLLGVALLAYAVSQRDDAAGTPRTLNLTEFGIALDLPPSLDGLTYTARNETPNGPGTVLHMMTEDQCDIGAIYKIPTNAISKSGTTWTKETLEENMGPVGNNPARVKKFTDFYLVFEPSQAACSSDSEIVQQEAAQRLALWNSLVTARFMQ